MLRLQLLTYFEVCLSHGLPREAGTPSGDYGSLSSPLSLSLSLYFSLDRQTTMRLITCRGLSTFTQPELRDVHCLRRH